MTAWRHRRRPRTAEQIAAEREADRLVWAALVRACELIATDPLNASYVRNLECYAAKAVKAAPPGNYTPGSVWAVLLPLAKQFLGETLYARFQIADDLRRAAEACAPLLEPPRARSRLDIEG